MSAKYQYFSKFITQKTALLLFFPFNPIFLKTKKQKKQTNKKKADFSYDPNITANLIRPTWEVGKKLDQTAFHFC